MLEHSTLEGILTGTLDLVLLTSGVVMGYPLGYQA